MSKNQNSRVALVRTDDRIAGINKAIKLLDLNPVRGKAVALKPIITPLTLSPLPLIMIPWGR
jgi:hypothetical protein